MSGVVDWKKYIDGDVFFEGGRYVVWLKLCAH